MLAVTAATVGLTVLVPAHDVPSYVAGGVTTGMTTCGRVPTSFGLKADLLRATVSAPAQAASGARLELTVDVFSVTGRPITLDTGSPEVLIARDGYVVGTHPNDSAPFLP